MARDLMDDTYYTCSGGKIPVKWTPPEVNYEFIYNSIINFILMFMVFFLRLIKVH